MEPSEWIENVRKNSKVLANFVRDWHPSSYGYRDQSWLDISAPAAEVVCQKVRKQIQKESSESPLMRFSKALDKGDTGEIYSILQQAWFGVPESSSCWSIKGFSEAVDLLDDPPEQEEIK